MTEIFTDNKTEALRESTAEMIASAGHPSTLENPIVCGVANCVYHDGISRCTASKVQVGPGYAKSSVDTVCATFRPKVLM